jgi:hypothetical protein
MVCLIKRPGYMLGLAAPRQSPTCLSWEQAAFQARFKQWDQTCEFTLALPVLQAFYEDLSVLLEYCRQIQDRTHDGPAIPGGAAGMPGQPANISSPEAR